MKYDKINDKFIVRHYEDLSNQEIISYIDKIDDIDLELSKKYKELDNIKFKLRELEAKINDSENLKDVVSRVTHIYRGVPVMEYCVLPSTQNNYNGTFTMNMVTMKHESKSVNSWIQADLSNEDKLKIGIKGWNFKLKDSDAETFSFLKGYSLEFVKFIAIKFMIDDVSCDNILDNFKEYEKMFTRINKINNITNK